MGRVRCGAHSSAVGWLEALSARPVSPAAGSAADLAAALGVALLIKLARRTRPQEISGYEQLLDRLLGARDRLTALAEADASAITAWLSTRQLEERDPARQAALKALVDVPLEAAELCRAMRLEAQPLLERGHPPARPDGHAGVQLLEASQQALCLLVQANLPTLTDAALIETVRSRLENL